MSKRRFRSAYERNLIRYAQEHGWDARARNGMNHTVLVHSKTGVRMPIPSTAPGHHLHRALLAKLAAPQKALPNA